MAPQPIDGLTTRDLDVNVDRRGHLVEIFRSDWKEYDPRPEMAYYSVTYPGVIRAWHKHERGQVDHFTCPIGRIRVAVYDDRDNSATNGNVFSTVIGEGSQQVVRIPGGCWHGFRAIGSEPSVLVNFPTSLYDYEDPDEVRLPWDSDEIPFDWEEPVHG